MRNFLLSCFILLGYVAILFVIALLISAIFTKRFSRLWRPCFYLCCVALAALMAVFPITYFPGGINDDFGNNALMFFPLCIACSALPFAVFAKPQRYLITVAVLMSIAVFFGYVHWQSAQHPFGSLR
jgi:hypothetical protein